MDLAGKATGFRWSLPSGIVTALADLVQAIHRYCPIEGRDTQPIGRERAPKNGAGPCRRDLFETNAHIAVQK